MPHRIDRDDGALTAIAPSQIINQLRLDHGRRVHADLVRPCLQQETGIITDPDAASTGQGDAERLANPAYRVVLMTAPLGRRRHVQENQLIRPLTFVVHG